MKVNSTKSGKDMKRNSTKRNSVTKRNSAKNSNLELKKYMKHLSGRVIFDINSTLSMGFKASKYPEIKIP